MRLLAVILCGGGGSRLWPLSNELCPKPFLRLPGGNSLLQDTFARTAMLGADEVTVAIGDKMFYRAAQELRACSERPLNAHFIVEPQQRDTAPALIAAALDARARHGDETVMITLSADHVVEEKGFSEALRATVRLAEQGQRIALLGIRPQRPECGYGYLEMEGDGESVKRFVEKPDLQRAREFLASGRHYWNAGVLCAPVGVLLAAAKRWCPELLQCVESALQKGRHRAFGDGVSRIDLDPESYGRIEGCPIERAVLERESSLVAVRCAAQWDDIGVWERFAEHMGGSDANGNWIAGEVVARDTQHCVIHGSSRPVAALGVSDLLIVDAPGGVLVASRERGQEVGKLVASGAVASPSDSGWVAEKGCPVYRPWGTYTVLEVGQGFKIKRIVVDPGQSLSLQRHRRRSEHWVVIEGRATVTRGGEVFELDVDQSTYIREGELHRLANLGGERLVIIEVQSGDYLEEDDIERFADQYQRQAGE